MLQLYKYVDTIKGRGNVAQKQTTEHKMFTKHLNKEDTTQSLEKELGFDWDGITKSNVKIISFEWVDCSLIGTVCNAIVTAWGESKTFTARWDTVNGWTIEGDEMPDADTIKW